MAEPIYDPDTEELKELVKRQAVKIDDMQRTLHSMQNAQRRHFIYKVVWWLLVTGIAGYAYYTYLWPQVQNIMALYGSAEGLSEQVQEFFRTFGTTGTSTTQ